MDQACSTSWHGSVALARELDVVGNGDFVLQKAAYRVYFNWG